MNNSTTRRYLAENRDVLIPLTLSMAIVGVFVAYLYLSGKILDFFVGEEFYVLHNAVNYSHTRAWINYFLQNGRIFEGIYWTYLYEIVDYSPALIRLFSYLLYMLSSLLATLAVVRIFVKNEARRAFAFVLPLLFFFNLHSLNWATRLSGDNSRLALILFFIAVLLLQSWAKSGRKAIYLVLALLFHLISVFTYESTMLLLPAGFLLALPLLDQNDLEENTASIIRSVLIYSTISIFFVFVPYMAYLRLNALPDFNLIHPAISRSSVPVLTILLGSVSQMGNYLANLGNTDVLQRGLWLPISFLVVVGYLIFKLWGQFENGATDIEQAAAAWLREPKLMLFLAGLWLFFTGMYPYALLGTDPDSSRIFVTAFLGMAMLIALAYVLSPSLLRKAFLLALIGLWMLLGIQEAAARAEYVSQFEEPYNTFYVSLAEQVPGVKPNTTFVWYDFDTYKWGCGPSLMMLYRATNLNCAWFSSTEEDYVVDRYEEQINAHQGGWIRNENVIIIGRNEDGTVFIIPEITPQDNLLINWISTEPIATDYRRIINDASPSPMLLQLQERQSQLRAGN